MPKEQGADRIEASKGKLNAVAGEVGNQAIKQVGPNQQDAGKNQPVAVDAKKSAKSSPGACNAHEATAKLRRDQMIVSDLWGGSLTIYSL